METLRRFGMVCAVLLFAAPACTGGSSHIGLHQGCNMTDANQPFGLAFWSTSRFIRAARGVWSVLAMQNTGMEDGHNTDLIEERREDGVHMNSVLTDDLDKLVVIGNFAYYEFALDLDEPATNGQSLDPDSVLSLDELKICFVDTGDLTRADDCPADPETYSLDLLFDRTVLLDYNYLGNGNGGSDLFVYIPYALMQSERDYFYLYSSFGYQAGYETEGTYEEWAYQQRVGVNPTLICPDGSIGPPCPGGDDPPTAAPEPASMLMLGTGLMWGAAKVRKRMRTVKDTQQS